MKNETIIDVEAEQAQAHTNWLKANAEWDRVSTAWTNAHTNLANAHTNLAKASADLAKADNDRARASVALNKAIAVSKTTHPNWLKVMRLIPD